MAFVSSVVGVQNSAFLAQTSRRPCPGRSSASRRVAPVATLAADKDSTAPSGLQYLSPEAQQRASESGMKFEKIKVAKDGSAMWTEIYELAELLRKGESTWEEIGGDDIDIRFKWAGMFHRRKATPGRFMVRLKVPNGIISSDQMRLLATSVDKYGKDGCLDITTRQNMQLRGVVLEDAPELFDKLYENGLTSFMSGMDNVRNIVGSPIAGIDPHELIDTRQLCTDINDMLTDNRKGNPEFTNLPRKFNICVSGSRDDFAHTHINDLGFVPIAHPETGEMGFNVIVGGLFSIKRNDMSISMDTWVRPDQVVDLSRAVLRVFRDNGERKVRQQCRLMYLLDNLGVDKFRELVGESMGLKLPLLRGVPEKYDEEFPRRDLLGVHPQKQEGLSWVGFAIPAGRLTAEDANGISALADKYSAGEIRLTVEQNVILPNVAKDQVDALLAEPLLKKFSPNPANLSRGLVSCTGSQFCPVAIVETKNRAMALVEELEKQLDVPQLVRMHWTGCPNSCGQVQVADIGFMGAPAKLDGKAVEGVNIYLGGEIGEDPKLGAVYKKGVPCEPSVLVPTVAELLKEKFGATEKSA